METVSFVSKGVLCLASVSRSDADLSVIGLIGLIGLIGFFSLTRTKKIQLHITLETDALHFWVFH